MSYDAVACRLGLGEEHEVWREGFEHSAGWVEIAEVLPTPEAVPSRCAQLEVPSEAIALVVDAVAQVHSDPALARLLVHNRYVLDRLDPLGQRWSVPWPQLPARIGPAGPLFYLCMFMSAVGQIRAAHERLEVPADVSRLTLCDVGRRLELNHRVDGEYRLTDIVWLTGHFTGALYELGRLQFSRSRSGTSVPGGLGAEGVMSIEVHVAETGPLDPDACDAAFAQARSFFPRRFPDEDYRAFVCWSWLMDQQLALYLPQDSNLVRFQRRFTIIQGDETGDPGIVYYVFRSRTPELASLPRDTTLRRAILDHMEAGGHWAGGIGSMPFQLPVPKQ